MTKLGVVTHCHDLDCGPKRSPSSPPRPLSSIPASANNILKMESGGIDLNTHKIREWRSIVTLIVFVITSEFSFSLADPVVQSH